MAMLNSQRVYFTYMSQLKWLIFVVHALEPGLLWEGHLCHGADAGAMRNMLGTATLQWQVTCKLSAYTINHQKKTKWEFLKMGKSMKTPKLSVSLLKMTHHLDLKHGAPRDPLAPQIHLRHRIRKNSPALLRR